MQKYVELRPLGHPQSITGSPAGKERLAGGARACVTRPPLRIPAAAGGAPSHPPTLPPHWYHVQAVVAGGELQPGRIFELASLTDIGLSFVTYFGTVLLRPLQL